MIGGNRSGIDHGRRGLAASLGLGQYETLFRQNDIDSEVLSELTEGDLEKFGVSFGHQKRLNSPVF